MICPNCNSKIPDNSTFCENCGVGFNRSANNILNNFESAKANVSLGCIILSLVFPVFGFILYFMFKNKRNDASKKILKASIAGLIITVVLTSLVFAGKRFSQPKNNKNIQQQELTDPRISVMPVDGVSKEMVRMTLSKYGAVDSSASNIGVYRIYVGSNMEKESLETIARELSQNKIVKNAYVEYPSDNVSE